ncbi:acyl-coenzyme A thioesterase 13-like [Rhopilema esculentum]|uniref:acyl-coenzyme A thioesterase 13-like n=1 Tax=Rhopilema esculentum TaxID=499914 RepID=UPI0031DD2779
MATKLGLLKNMLSSMKSSKGFDKVYRKLQVLDATEGRCTLSWKVDDDLLNMQGTLHGGLISSVIDTATTMALTTAGKGKRGVSLELSVSYISAAKLGEVLTIQANCKKVGNTIAFTESSITNEDGKLIATGKHTKFVGDVGKKES